MRPPDTHVVRHDDDDDEWDCIHQSGEWHIGLNLTEALASSGTQATPCSLFRVGILRVQPACAPNLTDADALSGSSLTRKRRYSRTRVIAAKRLGSAPSVRSPWFSTAICCCCWQPAVRPQRLDTHHWDTGEDRCDNGTSLQLPFRSSPFHQHQHRAHQVRQRHPGKFSWSSSM